MAWPLGWPFCFTNMYGFHFHVDTECRASDSSKAVRIFRPETELPAQLLSQTFVKKRKTSLYISSPPQSLDKLKHVTQTAPVGGILSFYLAHGEAARGQQRAPQAAGQLRGNWELRRTTGLSSTRHRFDERGAAVRQRAVRETSCDGFSDHLHLQNWSCQLDLEGFSTQQP